MNATLMAKTAYSNSGRPARTARDAEYEVFARTTRCLKQANTQAAEDFPNLVRAVHDNRKLWTVLAADVALPENGLSPELRSRLTYLAEFTRVHSRKILAREASADILVEINTAIMRGLRQGSGAP